MPPQAASLRQSDVCVYYLQTDEFRSQKRKHVARAKVKRLLAEPIVRRKQYEYYRDRVLTFDEAVA